MKHHQARHQVPFSLDDVHMLIKNHLMKSFSHIQEAVVYGKFFSNLQLILMGSSVWVVTVLTNLRVCVKLNAALHGLHSAEE